MSSSLRLRCGPLGQWILLLAALFAAISSGCQIFGFFASGTPFTILPNYKGLAHQKCAIMVWASPAVSIDQPSVQVDAASGLQAKIEAAKAKELDGATFVPANQVLRFQEDHPELEYEPATDAATRLPASITRLIYVEISDLSTHPNESVELYRGTLTASVRVIEISNGQGKQVYQEDNIAVVFPRKCPPEGQPDLSDRVVYRGTMEAFTAELANRFIPHDKPEENATDE